jgi:hypothetical protein
VGVWHGRPTAWVVQRATALSRAAWVAGAARGEPGRAAHDPCIPPRRFKRNKLPGPRPTTDRPQTGRPGQKNAS